MPVEDCRARSRDERRDHLVLVTPVWRTREDALADVAIAHFFAELRRAYVVGQAVEVVAYEGL